MKYQSYEDWKKDRRFQKRIAGINFELRPLNNAAAIRMREKYGDYLNFAEDGEYPSSFKGERRSLDVIRGWVLLDIAEDVVVSPEWGALAIKDFSIGETYEMFQWVFYDCYAALWRHYCEPPPSPDVPTTMAIEVW